MKTETMMKHKTQAICLRVLRDLAGKMAADPDLEDLRELQNLVKTVDELRFRLMDVCHEGSPEPLDELSGRALWEVYQPTGWEAGDQEAALVSHVFQACKEIGHSPDYAAPTDLTPAQRAAATNHRRHEEKKNREAMKKAIVLELQKVVADPTTDKKTRNHAISLLAEAQKNGVRV